MRLDKLFCVMIALLTINTAAYAIEVSVGASFGAGMPIFRGTNYKDTIDGIKHQFPDAKKTTFTLIPQIDVMIEFIPFLALETGLGFKYSTLKYVETLDRAEIDVSYTRSKIYIPIMLRGQFEYSLGVTYISAGIKLGFPVSDYDVTALKDLNYSDQTFEHSIDASPFTLDIAFALGQEFRIVTSHYVGVRIGYDLNVVEPFATASKDDFKNGTEIKAFPDYFHWFHDDFTVALTYRYAFGSKWKK